MSLSVTLHGRPVERVELSVPYQGAPVARVNWHDGDPQDLSTAGLRVADASGAVLLELSGTLQDSRTGSYAGLRHWAQFILGKGGWGNRLPEKPYHNDAGVSAAAVAQDAAREAGEVLGTFSPTSPALAADYARRGNQEASVALEAAAGGATWWVGYDGITHVGTRPESEPDPSAYRVLDFDPRTRDVKISLDNPSLVAVGSLLRSERFAEPLRVRSLDLFIGSDGIHITAHCGIATISPLADAVLAIVRKELSRHIWGAYDYRVVEFVAERVTLQAVRASPNLPDLVAVSMWPGVGGIKTTPQLSSIVMVDFAEGDPQRPRICRFVGQEQDRGVPTAIDVGKDGLPAARQSDAVTTILPPMVITGTMMVAGVPTAFQGVGITPTGQALGSITTGSALMKIATEHG